MTLADVCPLGEITTAVILRGIRIVCACEYPVSTPCSVMLTTGEGQTYRPVLLFVDPDRAVTQAVGHRELSHYSPPVLVGDLLVGVSECPSHLAVGSLKDGRPEVGCSTSPSSWAYVCVDLEAAIPSDKQNRVSVADPRREVKTESNCASCWTSSTDIGRRGSSSARVTPPHLQGLHKLSDNPRG